MRPRALLINPWIYDFAAYNLWVRPLGLLMVAEYLSAYDVDLFFIDCTDAFKTRRDGTGKFIKELVEKPEILKGVPRLYKRYGISVDEFLEKVRAAMPVDAVLITSIMSYWYPGIQKAIQVIRDVSVNVPIILGGIYVTLHHDHASRHSGADFIYTATVDDKLHFVLDTFGLRLKKRRRPIPYYKLNLYDRYPFAPLLTGVGCPFNCSYCASRLLADTYQKRPPGDVVKEIIELHNAGVRDFAFYDDALLVDSDNHTKPMLRSIVEAGLDVRFHTPNGLHARFLDEELAGLMKATTFTSIRLSLETVNDERQKDTGGKVNNEDVERALELLTQRGFAKKDIGVYLMYGLPGQDLEEVKEGIRFLKRLGVRINLTEFSPIKGTQSWNELLDRGIICEDLDPLLTNNTVFSYLYSDYDPKEVDDIRRDVKKYNSE